MTNNKTYIIVCGRGLTKHQCPIISNVEHCVDCNFVRYALRVTEKEEPEKTAEQTENSKEDGN